MLRKWGSTAIAAVMLASSSVAVAADQGKAPNRHQEAALLAGKAAGIHKAQWVYSNGKWLWIAGTAVIVAGAALAASGGSSHNTTATSTTGTP